jgi:hypothetical protein
MNVHDIVNIQNIMHCCCILHNHILIDNGFDTRWEDDVEWDSLEPDADLDSDVAPEVHVEQAPEVPVEALVVAEPINILPTISTVTSVAMRSYDLKKTILVNHFLHWYNRGLLCWPKNMGVIRRGLLPILSSGGEAAMIRSRNAAVS